MPENRHAVSSSHTASPGAANAFAEFLNPNSMITPGAAGAFTMVITNTLCQQFTQLPLNYTGLAVSFIFGSVVFGYGASLLSRIGYFIINSLIIFVVAAGSSAVGTHIGQDASIKTAAIDVVQPASGNASTFGLASADKPADNSGAPNKPPEKPKFFRKWL